MDFVCDVDDGLCCDLFPFRHSSKRDKGKQKRTKRSPKQPANADRNDNAHISQIGEGGQQAFCGSEDGVKTDDSALLQVFRHEIGFCWRIRVLVWCYTIARKWGIGSRAFLASINGAHFLVFCTINLFLTLPDTRCQVVCNGSWVEGFTILLLSLIHI